MANETCYTPRELELMILHELRTFQDVPTSLLVRIVRTNDSWRAEAHFKNGHGLVGHAKAALIERVGAAGMHLASTHKLIGGGQHSMQ